MEGKDAGGATERYAAALLEELGCNGEQLANPNRAYFCVRPVRDLPRRTDSMLAERRDGVHEHGANVAGESAEPHRDDGLHRSRRGDGTSGRMPCR